MDPLVEVAVLREERGPAVRPHFEDHQPRVSGFGRVLTLLLSERLVHDQPDQPSEDDQPSDQPRVRPMLYVMAAGSGCPEGR